MTPLVITNRIQWHAIDVPIREGIEPTILNAFLHTPLIETQILSSDPQTDRFALVCRQIHDRRLPPSLRHDQRPSPPGRWSYRFCLSRTHNRALSKAFPASEFVPLIEILRLR